MILNGMRIGPIAFDTGAASGDQTITVELDAIDLSRCKIIDMHVSLTTADAAADDTLSVTFEETFDRVTWDERIRSHVLDGAMTASAAAPEVRNYRCSVYVNLDTTEEAYETTGSAGGAPLAAGTVRNGPFAPRLYGTEVPFTGQKTHRLRFIVSDPDSDGRFAGQVNLVAYSPA